MSENEQRALKTVKNYTLWSAGAGLIPIPCVDMAAVGALQLKMLADISKIYGVPFQENRGKAAIASLGGFMIPHLAVCGPVGKLLKHVPLLGPLVGAPASAAFSAAYAWALGKVFIQHFESGGTFLNFNPEQVKEHFKTAFTQGRRMVANMITPEKNEAPA